MGTGQGQFMGGFMYPAIGVMGVAGITGFQAIGKGAVTNQYNLKPVLLVWAF